MKTMMMVMVMVMMMVMMMMVMMAMVMILVVVVVHDADGYHDDVLDLQHDDHGNENRNVSRYIGGTEDSSIYTQDTKKTLRKQSNFLF